MCWCFLICLAILWYIKFNIIVFLVVMCRSTKSENHEHEDFWDFWKVAIKIYESKVKQNNSMELLGDSVFMNYNQNIPPDPQAPNPEFFHIP